MSLDKNVQSEFERLNEQYSRSPPNKRLEKIYTDLTYKVGDLEAFRAIEKNSSKKDACYTLIALDYENDYVSKVSGLPIGTIIAYKANLTMGIRLERKKSVLSPEQTEEIKAKIDYRLRNNQVARIENGKVIKMSEDLAREYHVLPINIMGIQAAYSREHPRLKKRIAAQLKDVKNQLKNINKNEN